MVYQKLQLYFLINPVIPVFAVPLRILLSHVKIKQFSVKMLQMVM